MNARTGGMIMASGSTNRSTGTGTGSRSAGSQPTRTSARTTSSKSRKKKHSAVSDQALDDIVMIVSAAICIFLFLC